MKHKIKIEDLPARYQAQIRSKMHVKSPAPIEKTAKPCLLRVGKRVMNKTEASYQREVLGGGGLYEAITFKLPGGSRYTPDFVLFHTDGRFTCHEVKGAYRLGSQGRAATAFREVVAAFPQIEFVWAVRKGVGEYKSQICNPY